MNHSSPIEHQGVIQEVDGNNVKVALVVTSACSTCHAKQACNLSDQEIKVVEAFDADSSFKVGETVNVILTHKNATTAVFYGYLLPFLVVFLTLILGMAIFKNELKAGIIALITLLPYYLILYFFRQNFKKRIVFQIEKI